MKAMGRTSPQDLTLGHVQAQLRKKEAIIATQADQITKLKRIMAAANFFLNTSPKMHSIKIAILAKTSSFFLIFVNLTINFF